MSPQISLMQENMSNKTADGPSTSTESLSRNIVESETQLSLGPQATVHSPELADAL